MVNVKGVGGRRKRGGWGMQKVWVEDVKGVGGECKRGEWKT